MLRSVPEDSVRCSLLGSFVPLPDQYVLDSAEIAAINTSLDFYNNIIVFVAEQNNLGFVDMFRYFQKLDGPLVYNGLVFSNEMIKGEFYSLDGIYPTDRGHALIANEFIKEINRHYRASLNEVDVTGFHGVLYP